MPGAHARQVAAQWRNRSVGQQRPGCPCLRGGFMRGWGWLSCVCACRSSWWSGSWEWSDLLSERSMRRPERSVSGDGCTSSACSALHHTHAPQQRLPGQQQRCQARHFFLFLLLLQDVSVGRQAAGSRRSLLAAGGMRACAGQRGSSLLGGGSQQAGPWPGGQRRGAPARCAQRSCAPGPARAGLRSRSKPSGPSLPTTCRQRLSTQARRACDQPGVW